MGTWGVGIAQNDTFCEVQEEFRSATSEGAEPLVIAEALRMKYFDSSERLNALYAIADALWHCNSINAEWIYTVTQIAQCGADEQLWRESGADARTMAKRRKVLEAFMNRIMQPPAKKQVWSKQKNGSIDLCKGDCFWYKSKGRIYGALVADIINCYYLIGLSDELHQCPNSVEDILDTPMYTTAWFSDVELLSPSRRHRIGNVTISKDYNGRCGLLIFDDGSVTVNNPGQTQTWSHEFCCLRLPDRPLSALLNANSLPRMILD